MPTPKLPANAAADQSASTATPESRTEGALGSREWEALILAVGQQSEVLIPAGHTPLAVLRNRAILLLARHGLKGVALPGLKLGQLSVSRRGTALDGIDVPSHDEAEQCAACAVVDWAEVVTAHRADGDAGVWVVTRRSHRSRPTHRCRRPWRPPSEFADEPLLRTVSRGGRLGRGAVSREQVRSTLLAVARRAGITRQLGLGAFGCGRGPLAAIGRGSVTATLRSAAPSLQVGAVTAATAQAYRADWSLFAAWCRATDRQALPAEAATVDDFLADHPGPATTHRRRRTAIRHLHRQQGFAPPDRPLQRRPAKPLASAADVSALLKVLPRTGWTTGAFGRRDALLVLLRYRAGLTIAELHALTTADIACYNGDLHISVGHAEVVLRKTRRTDDCPGCCWLRWQVLLRHARFHSPATVLAGLVAGTASDDHVCDRPEQLELGSPVPVFLPMNRWGAFPLPLHATAPRSLTALAVQHATGTAPVHAAVPIHITPTGPAVQQVVEEPIPLSREQLALITAAGTAARRQAVADLAGTADRLDAVESSLDDLTARLDQLLATAWP